MVLRDAAVLAALGLCVLAGCGDDDSAAGDARPATLKIATKELRVTEPGVQDQVAIDAPRTVPAGLVQVSFENRGKSPHDAQLVRVDGDRKRKAVIVAFEEAERGIPLPSWLHGAGGVGPIQGGARATATQVLVPGDYYVVDTEATGDSGQVNSRQGGIRSLEVTPVAGEPGEVPGGDATIAAEDYGFDVSGIEPGSNRVTFENEGSVPHQLRAFPVRAGADMEDAEGLFKPGVIPETSAASSPLAPGPIVGTARIEGDAKQLTDLRFAPGRYVLVCFVVDRDGKPHQVKGMVEGLDVE